VHLPARLQVEPARYQDGENPGANKQGGRQGVPELGHVVRHDIVALAPIDS